jgi:PAS domain S-box-containing protein
MGATSGQDTRGGSLLERGQRSTGDDAGGLFGVVDATPTMLRTLDKDGHCVYANGAWLSFTGAPAANLTGDGWLDCLHPQDAETWRTSFASEARRHHPFEVQYRIRRHDRTFRWLVDNVTPRIERGEVLGFVSVSFDVTDYRETEQNLRLGGELYHALAETIPALVLTTSAAGEVQYCNARLLDYCGVDIDDLQGARWVDLIHPDDVAAGRDVWERRLQTLVPFSAEYRIRRHDGVYRWYLTHTAPLRSQSGEIQAWIGVSVDVDDRRQAEQRLVEAADGLLRASQAKDEFLGLVSHELRTPITTIYGNAQVLRRMGTRLDPTMLAESIVDIEQEAIRLQQLVDNMFVLARIESERGIETEPVLLGRIVTAAVAGHHGRFRGRRIDVFDEAGDVPARGSPLYVDQAIRNLLSNAEKYSVPDVPFVVLINRSDNQLAVRVLDRGMGLEPGDEALVFDTFYRASGAQARAPGAGIGLAVVHRLIEAQGGEVWIHAREGGGVEAGFTLPLEVEEGQ